MAIGAETTVVAGEGIKRLYYDAYYWNSKTHSDDIVSGSTSGTKYLGVTDYLVLYCDANDPNDMEDGYGAPLYIDRCYIDYKRYTITENFYTGYEIDTLLRKQITVRATELSKTITYVYNDGTELKATFKKKKGETHYIIKRPKRQGKVFLYWTDNLGTGKHWRAGDAYTTNANVTFTGVWVSKTYFYWHGSNDNDSAYFQVGKRVDLAVTATNWNNLRTYINMLREYCYLSAVSLGTVSEESEISASGFNTYSNAIQDCVNAMGGTSPPTVSEGALIRVSDYNGPGSIKAAANSVMDAL